ncbi:MAG: restriction endonuclease subunit S [Hormoscilla sp. GM7CHS1pb]|nr:restriction endonuclease subunit S [Hormoscilla sp. GM7CHS1pb]
MSKHQLAIDNSQVSEGYKKTEVGVIPEDWEVKKLGDILHLKNGFAFRSEYFSLSGPIVLTPGNFRLDGGLYFNDKNTKRYSGKFPESMIFQNGDLLVVMTDLTPDCNLLGKPAFVNSEEIILHNQRIGKINLLSEHIDKNFLYCILLSSLYLKKIKEQATGSTVRHTSNKSIYSIYVPIPPLPEQRAIAQTLSDVDGLIAALDKLIAKKRNIKTATMQELLTGKKRLPGFGDEWHEVLLGELGVFSKGSGIKKDDVLDYGFACVRYGEIYTKHHDFIKIIYSFISEEIAKNSQLIKSGDLLFAGSGETAEEIGKCVAFLKEEIAYAGGDIIIFSPKEQDSMFLGYLMNYESIVRQKARMGQGDAVVHIQAKNLAQLQFNLPSLEEQRAIASILSDMDAEIAALEKRRAKTQAMKQGMMQELLTGKTRLIDPNNP